MATLSDRDSNWGDRPDKPLVVKCSYNRSMRRVTFGSATQCTYSLLRIKVEQCFALNGYMFLISYTDDDGEITDISSDDDLTEAINYFYDGDDDSPVRSGASGGSSRSSSSRKVTLRVKVTLDNDGPSLSDTASLASLEDYESPRDGGGRGDSLRLSGSELSFELEDDAITVSSRDVGGGRARFPGRSNDNGTAPRFSLPGYALPTISTRPPSPPVSPNMSPAIDTSNPFALEAEPAASPRSGISPSTTHTFRQPGLHEDPRAESSSSLNADRNVRRTRAGPSRINGIPEESYNFEDDISGAGDPFGDVDLELQRSEHHYYYAYTGEALSHSGGSVVPEPVKHVRTPRDRDSQSVDLESLYASNHQQPSPHGLAWIESQQSLTSPFASTNGAQHLPRSNSAPEPGPSRRSPHSFVSEPSHSFPTLANQYPDIPPEVLRFVDDDQAVVSEPPIALTDCSVCGIWLDAFRYVCTTCGPKDAKLPGDGDHEEAKRSPIDKGKDRAISPLTDDGSVFSDNTEYVAATDIESDIALVNLSPRKIHTHKPLESSHIHSPNAASKLTLPMPEQGYELCSSCIYSAGVEHAVDQALGCGDSSASTSIASISSSDGSERPSPVRTRQKYQFRHCFREKMWSTSGWKDVEQDDNAVCSICSTSLTANRYKCVSCNKFDLCRDCYSQVHDIHPAHAFLSVPDQPKQSFDFPKSNSPHDAETLDHPGVKCTHCLQDIVGARFHCAICTSVDICSNCESAGLPGNLTAPKGGHDSSHIMIKIPYPLDSAEVEVASRRARQLWSGRDAFAVDSSANVSAQGVSDWTGSDYSPTVIGASRAEDQRTDASRYYICRGCNMPISGVRYQCAHCPSLPTTYSLCSNCEPQSYMLHDPMHAFLKIPRPVDRPIGSPFPILPPLYQSPVAQGADLDSEPKAYLRDLLHKSVLCDRCVKNIQGEWFRCVYCAKDLCLDCEEIGAHDPSHIFVVFKAPVNATFLKMVAPSPDARPLIPFPVYVD